MATINKDGSTPARRVLASMDAEKLRRIASMGGSASGGDFRNNSWGPGARAAPLARAPATRPSTPPHHLAYRFGGS